MSSPLSAPSVGRFTGIVLGFVVFVCVTMIGGAGYLKYQLDKAESVMAAPDNALGSDQDLFDRLRRDLGYGGFLGLAQAYVSTHDASGFPEMKTHIKSADEIMARLPDKTPAETRHELTAIVAVFDAALKKISSPTGEMGGDFSAGDLAPLYAAMPILDARVAGASAEARLAAQNKMQFWAMLLTLACWCSLIIAAACAAGIYLTLRDKHSAPMRALAQSIQNMSRGDMRTAIWGVERQDFVGELARAVDMARYHFSHLPDLSLLSDQGPIRLKFEGETRSLFEAMMKAISADSEKIREQADTLTNVSHAQRVSIAALVRQVEEVLRGILERGQMGDDEIRRAIHDMLGSAEGLKNAHAHAADQLNRLIPHIHERATNMAEITQVAGKQIGQTIKSLAASELGMKTNAEHANETLIKLAATADNLGERLFGAINLLQASGKIMAETVEEIKGSYGHERAAVQEVDLSPLAARLEEIAAKISALQAREHPAPDVGQAVGAHLAGPLEEIAAKLAAMQAQAARDEGMDMPDIGRLVAAQVAAPLEEIMGKLAAMQEAAQAQAAESAKAQSETNGAQQLASQLSGALQEMGAKISALQAQATENAQTDVGRTVAAQLAGSLDEIKDAVAVVRAKAEEGAAVDIGQTVAARLAGPLGEIKGALAAVQAKAEEAASHDIEQFIASYLAPKFDAISLALARGNVDASVKTNTALMELSDRVGALASDLPEEMRRGLQDELQRAIAAAPAPASIDLSPLGEKVDAMQARVIVELRAAARPLPDITALAAKIDGLVEAMHSEVLDGLSQRLHEDLQRLSAQIETVTAENRHAPGPDKIAAVPVELGDRMNDLWRQLAAQIEASRGSLLAEITSQIDKMEHRLSDKEEGVFSKTASDYATQRQIEQQTHILSELVSTLGVIDTHMQQLKAEMRGRG